jgi:hypothetical protein
MVLQACVHSASDIIYAFIITHQGWICFKDFEKFNVNYSHPMVISRRPETPKPTAPLKRRALSL